MNISEYNSVNGNSYYIDVNSPGTEPGIKDIVISSQDATKRSCLISFTFTNKLGEEVKTSRYVPFGAKQFAKGWFSYNTNTTACLVFIESLFNAQTAYEQANNVTW